MRKCLLRVQSRPLPSTSCFRRLTFLSIVGPEYKTRVSTHHVFSTFSPQCHAVSNNPNQSPLRPRWFDLSESSKSDDSVTESRKFLPPKGHENDPEAWISIVDRFLPKELRISGNNEPRSRFQGEANLKDVIKVLTFARSRANLDVLAYMTLNKSRHKAVLYLTDLLLRSAASFAEESEDDVLPSNISWPVSFTQQLPQEMEVDCWTSLRKKMPATWEEPFRDPSESRVDEKCMQFILPLLATLTITATTKPEAEAKDIMRTVHQIIARMHNLDLIPSDIYNYTLPHGTTTVQRPPILHLLSSRILSTVSDAVWRSHQDEAIARAVSQGRNYKQISQDVPGGRFRLKVRDLGPEVWLEFLLWCCVEGGYASAGVRIINTLRNQSADPWYAVHWCPNPDAASPVPKIDWDNVKRRHGGTVGQLEGYSAEEPFAHIPHKTISAEVVLALVDSLFNCINTGVRGSGISVEKIQTYILDVVSFLEPHALGPEYFNYLTVRFLQTGSIYIQAQPDALRRWYSIISQLRSLQTIRSIPDPTVGLDLEFVASQTELQAGVLHQALQAYINQSNATQAVNVFTDIQRHVDSSKLESIENFLTSTPQLESQLSGEEMEQKYRHDFMNSHGQLPTYKMAALLNMVTDAQLFGLGDWLIDSEDIDGPMIPQTVYPQLSMTVAVTKYADATGDRDLIKKIITSRQRRPSQLSVNGLRALVNATISISSWSNASDILTSLKKVPGGGYSPRIIAKLAAKILRLESQLTRLQQDKDLAQGVEMLSDILAGRYDGPRADFTTSVKRAFDQQVGYLLRLFENLPASKLGIIGRQWKLKFPASNEANLAAETYNDVLSAIVEVRGAVEGRRMWDMFCKDPRSNISSEKVPLLGDYIVPDISRTDGDEEDIFYVLRSQDQMPQMIDDHVPIISTGYDEKADIPFEGEGATHSEQGELSFNPIVIPNIQTLHIIVRGAVAEKTQLKGLMKEKEIELNKVLGWATQFYKVFNYSKRDIEAEVLLPVSLKSGGTSNAQLKWLNDRFRKQSGIGEISRPDVSGMFNSAAPSTRLPELERSR